MIQAHPTPARHQPKIIAKDMSKKIYPPKEPTPRIPNDITMELENEVFQYEYITTNKKPSTLKKSAKVVIALASPTGLASILDKTKIDHIIQTISTNKTQPFSAEQILMVIYKQFSIDERIELYERLSLNNSPAYGGPGRQSLSVMDYNSYSRPGWSDIVWAWLRKPKLKTTATTKMPVSPDLEKAVAMAKAKLPNEEHNRLVKQLKEMKAHWDSAIIPKLANLYKASSAFEAWLGQFLEYGYNRATMDHPFHAGWLNPGFWAFQEWEGEWLKETEAVAGERQRNDASRAFWTRENIIEEIIEKMEIHEIKEQLGPEFGYDPELTAEASRRWQGRL